MKPLILIAIITLLNTQPLFAEDYNTLDQTLYNECQRELTARFTNHGFDSLALTPLTFNPGTKVKECDTKPYYLKVFSNEQLYAYISTNIKALNGLKERLFKEKVTTAEWRQIDNIISRCQKRVSEKHMLAMQAATHVYKATLPYGYHVKQECNKKGECKDISIFSESASGIKYYLLEPNKGFEHLPHILSFAGTEDARDWTNNLRLGLIQADDSGVLTKSTGPILALLKEGKNLIITGHSLGGGLAQFASAEIARSMAYNIAVEEKHLGGRSNWGNVELVTFNSFGSQDLDKMYRDKVKARINQIDILTNETKNRVFTKSAGDDINVKAELLKMKILDESVHYRLEYDVVSKLGRHFGEERTIPSRGFLNPLDAHYMTYVSDRAVANGGLRYSTRNNPSTVGIVISKGAVIFNKIDEAIEGPIR